MRNIWQIAHIAQTIRKFINTIDENERMKDLEQKMIVLKKEEKKKKTHVKHFV